MARSPEITEGMPKRAPASTKVKRKCASCGRLIDQEVLICPYCDDDQELQRQLGRTSDAPQLQVAACETDATLQVEAQVSNAINIRRIAIAAVLAVVLTVGTTLVSLVDSIFLMTDLSHNLTLLKIWAAFAVFIMIVGVSIIIFHRRLTRPSGSAILRHEEIRTQESIENESQP